MPDTQTEIRTSAWKHLGNGPEGFDHYGWLLHECGNPIERNWWPKFAAWTDPLEDEEPLLKAVLEWPNARVVPNTDLRVGDVLLFRMGRDSPALHSAVIMEPGIISHAYWGKPPTRTRLVPWWIRRIAYEIRITKEH